MKQLEVINLKAGYQTLIIDDVQISLDAKKCIAILGKNGSGKSTLFKAMMDNVEKCSGEVLIQGKDYYKLRSNDRAKTMTMLSQQFDLLEGLMVREIIEMGRHPYQNRFFDKATKLNMQIIEDLEISDLLDKSYQILSSGQKQLVQLARVVHQDTSVMLFDEPDSSLDYSNTHLIYKKIIQIVKETGKTALVILHDPMLALQYFDEVYIFDNGKIIEKINTNDSVEIIEGKLNLIYPELAVYKDKGKKLYYCSLK